MDRGHLVPNADFDYNATAALNTFILSNIAPQYHIFNAGMTILMAYSITELALACIAWWSAVAAFIWVGERRQGRGKPQTTKKRRLSWS